MKVLHIFSSWTKGGAEKSTLFLADSIQKYAQGVDNILAVPEDSFMFEEARLLNLKAYPFKAKGSLDLRAIMRLLKIVKTENIDIIHVHQGKLFWTALLVKFFRKKVKVVFHRRQDSRHSFYSKYHYRFADAVISVSEAVKKGLVEYEGVNAGKITVIYNGVNFAKFSGITNKGEIISKYNLEGKTVVGTVGAINDLKGKGQVYLVEAAAILKNTRPDIRYMIIGGGEGLESLKAYAAKLCVEDVVIFTGYQEKVAQYVSACDIMCLLSWHTEGMPNVLIEAQFMGKPVIATNIGGNPEAFVNGITGFLIKPQNAKAVAESITLFASSPKRTKAMGEEARKFVREKFTTEKMVQDTLAVYNKVLGG
ncbi:MAG: glycosyltransferase family 4 protein [Elusimicrobia bacterium]|nr:glycosyltransferase family 4 protein [Elusimicrobiota bacterium]